MWILNIKKKNLIDLLINQNLFDSSNVINTTSIEANFKDRNTVLLAWFVKPTNLLFFPNIICIPNNTTREFLAWVNTYIPSIRPFSAYFKIIEEKNIKNSYLLNESSEHIELMESSMMGTIITEILTHLENNDIKRLSPIAVKSTLSYTFANAFYLNLFDHSNEISERYRRLNALSKQKPRILSQKYIYEVWDIINMLNCSLQKITIQSNDTDKKIFNSAKNILHYGIINKTFWRALTKNNKNLVEINDLAAMTREERVRTFEKKYEFLSNNILFDKKISSFICAYLISQIQPGSLKYIELIKPCLHQFPDMLLWYGFISGLYRKIDIYNEQNGIGWRIRRDLIDLRHSFLNSRADISLDELEMLSDVDRPDFSFITESHTHIFVELIPFVYALVLWPPKQSTNTKEKGQQLEFFSDQRTDSMNPLSDLGTTLDKAKKLFDEYSRTLHEHSKRKGNHNY